MLVFPILLFAVTSCVIPTTKSAYLRNFSHFVADVEKNSEKFSLSDWQWANRRFGKYTGEWYDRFSTEFSQEENERISALKGRYREARLKSRFSGFFNNDFGKDLDRIKEDVRQYMKDDFRKDMDELSKGAREIGDSAKKVMEDIIREKNRKE